MKISNEDIVLDEEAFDRAVEQFEQLSQKLNKLRDSVEDMLTDLKHGFNTPAGVKFINSCEANIYEPLDAQKLVLTHISTTLKESKQKYESVFREYETLQGKINNK